MATILWTSGRAAPAGGNSAAAQLRECNPFLCRTASSFGGSQEGEKGIVLPELSCRNAAELTPPDFSAPGGQPPEQPERFGGSSAPGVHSQSCRSCLVWPPSWLPAKFLDAAMTAAKLSSSGGAAQTSAAVRQLSKQFHKHVFWNSNNMFTCLENSII